MAKPKEIYYQLGVGLPSEPKVRRLARYGAASRGIRDLYIMMLLHCKREMTDGMVTEEEIGVLVYPDSPKNGLRDVARLVECELVEPRDGGFYVPAYLKRNKSRDQILAETSEQAQQSSKKGTFGNHKRWHLDRGIFAEGCRYCDPNSSPPDRQSVAGSDSDLSPGDPQASLIDRDRDRDTVSDDGSVSYHLTTEPCARSRVVTP